MEFIKKVLGESYKKKIKFINTFIFVCLFILATYILEILSIKDLLAFIIVCLVCIIYAILYQCISRKEIAFNKTKMYDELKKYDYLNEFINTIDLEINSDKTIKYYDDIYRVGLIITETWFVFISSNNPKIRKTNEIYEITESLTNSSKYIWSVKFKDNSYFNAYINYDEIKNEIKEKYPNIYLE